MGYQIGVSWPWLVWVLGALPTYWLILQAANKDPDITQRTGVTGALFYGAIWPITWALFGLYILFTWRHPFFDGRE